MEESGKKGPSLALITTPASYYSTPKARYLGERYKANLDRLVEGIVRNPKTANLQFANNIAAVGGIGFFTHSAVKSPDERYLEVILAAPETFETSGEFSSKVHRLFSLYGSDLLSVLSSDSAIYNEKEVSGYGLNLSWRKIVADPRGPRVGLERAIVYFPKQKVRAFLTREVSQNDLLSEAVIFAAEEQGPINLVSYHPSESKPDVRPPIQEEDIATAKVKAEVEPEVPSQPTASQAAPSLAGKVEKKIETNESKQQPAKQAKLEGAGQVTKPTASGSNRPAAAPAPSKPPQGAIATKTVAVPRESKTVTEPLQGSKEKAEPNAPKQAAAERKPQSSSVSPMETGRSEQLVSPARPLQRAEQEPPGKTTKAQPVLETKASRESVEHTLTPPSALKGEGKSEGSRAAPSNHEERSTPRATAAPVAEANEQKTIESKNQPRVPTQTGAGVKTPNPVGEQKKSETPVAVAKLENRAAAGLKPAPPPPLEAKKEIPGAAANRNTSVQTKVEKTPSEAQPLVQKKAEPPAVVANKEIKTPALPKAPAAPISPAKQEKASEPKNPEAAALTEPIKPATPILPAEQKKAEPVPVAPKEAPLAADSKAVPAPAQEEKTSQKSENEQVALLRTKPSEAVAAKKPLVRPAPKALEGYVIQVAFSERAKAKHWAEAMEQRGYAVSVTETGGAGSVRVRIGNFAAADEAERQLRTFRQEGLAAIVINLPQAFRPAATAQAEESPSP